MIDTVIVDLIPACTNPASNVTSFRLATPIADSVVITLNDKPHNIVRTVFSRRVHPGIYQFEIDLTGFQPNIYRLYVHFIRPTVTYTSYGDIKVI
jgi:hypothetical protein